MPLVFFNIACTEGDVVLPTPAPISTHRERDDWVKPGPGGLLKFGLGSRRPNTIVLQNMESFAWRLLDDVWLNVWAPNVQVRQGGPYIPYFRDGGGWYVHLRCPMPVTRIRPGVEIEIAFDRCFFTTYDPGPGARVKGLYLAAREGSISTSIEGLTGPEVVRAGGRAPTVPPLIPDP
jgi:hypothetical protein